MNGAALADRSTTEAETRVRHVVLRNGMYDVIEVVERKATTSSGPRTSAAWLATFASATDADRMASA